MMTLDDSHPSGDAIRPEMPFDFSVEEKRFLIEAALLMRDCKRLDEAETMFSALLPWVEDQHLPRIGLGTISFDRGDFDEAIEHFESATKDASNSALAYAHLGEALAFGGHREEADLALEKATQLDPAGESGGNMAKTVKRFLESGLL